MDDSGNALIYNPYAADNKGTSFYPYDKGPEYFWENF